MKLLIPVVLLVVIIALQFDEDLSPTAERWIDVQEGRLLTQSDGYFYLLGIVASEEEDVLTTGKNLFSSYQLAEAQGDDRSAPVEYDLYPEAKKLPLPLKDNALFCDLKEDGCLDNILKNADQWQEALDKHRALLIRYQTYIDYLEYTTLSTPSVSELYPEYQYLKYGHRLKLLQILSLKYEGKTQDALDLLLGDLYKLRQQLKVADNFLHKMFFVHFISDDLNLILAMSPIFIPSGSLKIPSLNAAEMDVESSIIREFYMGYSLYKSLDRHPEILEEGGYLPGWIGLALFKPNMTINDDLPRRQRIIDLGRLSAKDFSLAVKEPVTMDKEINPVNYIGSVLNNIASPDYSYYIARLHDLNSKIAIVNYLLNDRVGGLVNPYYPDQTLDLVKTGRICLEGPLKDERNLRCAG